VIAEAELVFPSICAFSDGAVNSSLCHSCVVAVALTDSIRDSIGVLVGEMFMIMSIRSSLFPIAS
jgi:hypothetical protein